MIKRFRLIQLNFLPLVICLLFGVSTAVAREPNTAPLAFVEGESWGVQQKTVLQISEPGASEKSNHSMERNSALLVLRVFLNGSALVQSVNEDPTGKITHAYIVVTTDGRIYGVKNQTEEGAMPETADELVFLKMIKNSEEWLRVRTPIEYLKIPELPIEENLTKDVRLGRENWVIRRLPNENFEDRKCEVYLAATVRGGINVKEKTWLDRRRGKVLKKVLSQEGENSFETVETYSSTKTELLSKSPKPEGVKPPIPEEIANASKETLEKVRVFLEDAVNKSLLTLTEVKSVSLDKDLKYINGPYWGILEATIGMPKKPRLTHSIKITIKVNPRNETHDFFGFRVTPVHSSTLIVENERLRVIRVYIAADPGRILLRHQRKITGDGDHFAFADHINYELPATKTQIIIATLEYSEEMKPRAKALAGELDTNPLRELVWK